MNAAGSATATTAQGITFTLSGRERPLPMDLIPRVINAEEWRTIDAGVGQRIKALEMFLDDVYGLGQILAERIVPRALVTSSAHFHRAAHGFMPPNGYASTSPASTSCAIKRAPCECWRTTCATLRRLLRAENRRTLAHVVPELFPTQRVRAISEYPKLLGALVAAGPRRCSTPPSSS